MVVFSECSKQERSFMISINAAPNQMFHVSVASMAEIPFMMQMANVTIREIRKSAREEFRKLMLHVDSIATNVCPSSYITQALSMIAEIQHELCRLEHEMNSTVEWTQGEMVG